MRPGLALLLAAILAAHASGAEARTPARCPVANTDIAAALRALPGRPAVSVTTRRDPDSGEPVLRHVADFPGGQTVAVEQSSCRIWNLKVALLSPRRDPGVDDLARMAGALKATSMWRRHFAKVDIAAILRRELVSSAFAGGSTLKALPDNGFKVDETSEAILSLMREAPDSPGPYRSALTLTLSAER